MKNIYSPSPTVFTHNSTWMKLEKREVHLHAEKLFGRDYHSSFTELIEAADIQDDVFKDAVISIK